MSSITPWGTVQNKLTFLADMRGWGGGPCPLRKAFFAREENACNFPKFFDLKNYNLYTEKNYIYAHMSVKA